MKKKAKRTLDLEIKKISKAIIKGTYANLPRDGGPSC